MVTIEEVAAACEEFFTPLEIKWEILPDQPDDKGVYVNLIHPIFSKVRRELEKPMVFQSMDFKEEDTMAAFKEEAQAAVRDILTWYATNRKD